jgi:hypothetical protein
MPSWKKLIVSGSDASLSSLTTTGKLQLNSSETGSTIFEVNGVNGRLFTITDEMSGSLFNISTTAGLPVIEALSDGKVTLGPFSAQTEIDTSGNLELGGNISGSATSTGSFGRVEAAGFISAEHIHSTDDMTVADDLLVDGTIQATGNLVRGSYSGNKVEFVSTQQTEINDVFRIGSSSGKGTLGLYGNSARNSTTLFNFNFNSVTNKWISDHASVTYKNFYINADAILAFPGSSGASQAQDISIFKSNIVTEADHGPGRRLFLDFRHDDVDMFTADMSGSLYAFGNISGSATSTGSFGHLLVGGSELASSPDATDGSQSTISGSVTSTGSFGSVMQNGKHFPQVNSIGESFAFGTNAGSAFLGDSVNRINIAIGSNAGTAMADYGGNVYIGKNAAKLRTRGDSNVCIGPSAGGTDGDDFGDKNVFIGLSTGLAINSTNSDSNVFIGNLAGTAGQQSIANVLIGDRAGNTLTDSSRNVAIGIFAGTGFGVTNTTTENGVYIGQYARTSATNANNEIVIGSEAVGHGTDTITFGDNQITDVYFASGSSTGATFHGIKDFAGNISGSATSTGSFGELIVADKVQGNLTVGGQIIASGSANATDTIKIYGDASGNVGHAGITFDLDNSTNDAEAYLRLDRTSGTKYLGLTMQSDGRDGMRFMTGTTERLRINGNDVSGSSASVFSVGSLQSAGNITPITDDSVDLGAADKRFQNIFTTDLQLSNEGKDKGNEVDGTTGSWTIQEGEEELYLLNRKNGKKYKFMLQEIK